MWEPGRVGTPLTSEALSTLSTTLLASGSTQGLLLCNLLDSAVKREMYSVALAASKNCKSLMLYQLS